MPLMTYRSDLAMPVNNGGRERTREEFQRLSATAGVGPDDQSRPSNLTPNRIQGR